MMTLVLDVVAGTVLVGLVFHNALVAIGLEEGVHSLGVVPIPCLPLALDVVVLQVVHGVVVVIMGRRLAHEKKSKIRRRSGRFVPEGVVDLDRYLLVFRAGCTGADVRY